MQQKRTRTTIPIKYRARGYRCIEKLKEQHKRRMGKGKSSEQIQNIATFY